jgi:hypothetical protein
MLHVSPASAGDAFVLPAALAGAAFVPAVAEAAGTGHIPPPRTVAAVLFDRVPARQAESTGHDAGFLPPARMARQGRDLLVANLRGVMGKALFRLIGRGDALAPAGIPVARRLVDRPRPVVVQAYGDSSPGGVRLRGPLHVRLGVSEDAVQRLAQILVDTTHRSTMWTRAFPARARGDYTANFFGWVNRGRSMPESSFSLGLGCRAEEHLAGSTSSVPAASRPAATGIERPLSAAGRWRNGPVWPDLLRSGGRPSE